MFRGVGMGRIRRRFGIVSDRFGPPRVRDRLVHMAREDWALEISVAEPRENLDRLLDRLEANGVEMVAVHTDFYWTFASEDWTDVAREAPPVPDMLGSVNDDWEFLQETVADVEDWPPALVGAYLRKLAGIIRAVGEELEA